MVFSSIPVYLDPPNWHHHQQQPNQLVPPQAAASSASYEANSTHQHHQQQQHLLPPLPPPPPLPDGGGGGGGGGLGSIRPGSMADRARMAKIPQPEPGLKCPRCESTNTKFCYFNNYSLTQPRHFCKTCRRYWTRGGALRNVPVGGGCRRNKKTSSKPHKNSSSASSAGGGGASTSSAGGMMGHLPHHHHHQLPPPPPFMSSHLHGLSQFGVGSNGSSSNNNNSLGLNFGSGSGAMGMFHMGVSSSSSSQQHDSAAMVQQFPFFEAAAGPPGNLYGSSFHEDDVDSNNANGQRQQLIRALTAGSSSRVNLNPSQHDHDDELAPVKPELAMSHGLNLSRPPPPFADPDGSQYWGGGGGGNAVSWTDLTGLNSHN
ncbi:unnamed protein product [Linum trigynum]|uniref:Dof zinc finger protein n=1 Tax=Linum trigynum TaxID=586398 RepID=A0AAV2FQ79_9ROSI